MATIDPEEELSDDEIKTITPPVTKGSALESIPETKDLGTRARAVLVNLGVTHVSQLGVLTKKKVMGMENTGKGTWEALEHYKFAVNDMVTSNGKQERPKPDKPKTNKGNPPASPASRMAPSARAHYKEIRKHALRAGMVCFVEMLHEHDGENDEVGCIAIDPFHIISVDYGVNTHVMVHYNAVGQLHSVRVNHPMQVVMEFIAEAKREAQKGK